MIPRYVIIFAALGAGACASRQPEPRIDTALASSAVQEAAQQVRRCYRTPRVASSGKAIVTRLRVRYNEDGSLAALPSVIEQAGITPQNQPYANKMAEAAGLAIVQCAPVSLPAALHRGGWDELELTFAPSARA